MHIYIPTRGRADDVRQGTISLLAKTFLLSQTTLVTPFSEMYQYLEACMDAGIPARIMGGEQNQGSVATIVGLEYQDIAEKRLIIGQMAERAGQDKFVMMDDDVDFLIRKSVDDWPLRAQEPAEIENMIEQMAAWLNSYAQVSISSREGNNRAGVGESWQLVAECNRAMRIVAYRTEDFLSVEHGRVPVMEDIDVTLQLLESGRPNVILSYWANGQRMTNAPGGCSIWRTLEVQDAAAHRLAELHPLGIVTTRQKANKTDADGFGTRTEVTVQWKRAYQMAQAASTAPASVAEESSAAVV